jgi:hypothetical protein
MPTPISRPRPRRASATRATGCAAAAHAAAACRKRPDGSSDPVPGCGSGGAGDVPGADYCYLPPLGAAADAANRGGRGPPGGFAGGDDRLFWSRATGTATAGTSEVGGPAATAAAAAGGGGWCIGGALSLDGYRLLMGGCPLPPPGPGADAIGHAAYVMARMEWMDKLWHMDGPDCGSLVVELAVAAAAVAALQRRLGAVMAAVAAAWRQCGSGRGSSSAAVLCKPKK